MRDDHRTSSIWPHGIATSATVHSAERIGNRAECCATVSSTLHKASEGDAASRTRDALQTNSTHVQSYERTVLPQQQMVTTRSLLIRF